MGLYLAMVADISQYTMWSSGLPDLAGMRMQNPKRVDNSAIFDDGGILIAQVLPLLFIINQFIETNYHIHR